MAEGEVVANQRGKSKAKLSCRMVFLLSACRRYPVTRFQNDFGSRHTAEDV